MEEASKERPDGDRMLFAMQVKRFVYERAACAEKVLEALLVLLRTRSVAGWPSVDDRSFWGKKQAPIVSSVRAGVGERTR